MLKISLFGKRVILSIITSLLITGVVAYILDIPLQSMLADGFVVGLLIGIGGIFLRHPVFGFPTPAPLRGACFGVFGGLSTIFIATHPWTLLLIFLIMGSILDTVVSRFTGEGEAIL